jgi:uncharacterized protein (TIGR03382 family)
MQDSMPQFVEASAPLESAFKSTYQALSDTAAPLSSCGTEATYSVWESRVEIPDGARTADKDLALAVQGMDEGLRVQVDGHVVAYMTGTRDELVIPLLSLTDARKDHVVRLTHVNSCEDARPLTVAFTITDSKTDDLGGQAESGGCSSTGTSGPPLIALGLLGLLWRRRRCSDI